MRRLLVLDDDPDVGKTISFIAEGAGFHVRIAAGPDAFFELLERWDPSHIALDLVMPEMDGVEVVRHLADRQCAAAVILTSGVGGRVLDAARRSAVEHGLNVVGVLGKPFLPDAVRKLLKEEKRQKAAGLKAARTVVISQTALDKGELRHALQAGEIHLAYQPKINCATGALIGFEALARWHHPERGILMPDSFIPLAEETGLIDLLTTQIMERGLVWLSMAPRPDLELAVNVSAHSLADFQLADHVAQLCSAQAISPQRIILEITETATMRDPVVTLDLLTRFRMKGFQLSIDDFGTGYSSMVQLVRLPFSEMKVDKSFVMAALQSRESRAVVKSVVDLGHSLGLKVCAEGVENIETMQFLQSIGCDLAQGYFVARPVAAEQVLDWCREWESTRFWGGG